jgi:L-alanine-DL-glutamate epimerase-like enolase superfamily enzyme
VRVGIHTIDARLRAPHVSSQGTVDTVPLLLLRLEGADGFVGVGEAVALGIPDNQVQIALEDCREVLGDSDGEPIDELLAACTNLAVLPQAVAAIDLALLDLAGRRAGLPVWQLLSRRGASLDPEPVPVNATIAAADRAGAAAAAASARIDGFRCVKVKVGLGDDAGRVAAVRAAGGPEMSIRLDANGAWTVPEAVGSLRALAPAGLELCEEPVSGLDEIAAVAAESLVPVALDESAVLPGALDGAVCDAVCLKVSRAGGIHGVIEAARRAREGGYEVYLASMLDGPLGIAAALHAATVIDPDRPCGLATLSAFEGRDDVLPASGGAMLPPTGTGLGEGLVSWYGA